MSDKKKKIFPKLQKKLKDFLTDESGEITKKDALGIAAGAALLASAESIEAAGHSSSWTPSLPTNWSNLTIMNNSTCSHVSGIVNWHLSQTPSVSSSATIHTHNSHWSHGSHGSHWSRW